MSGQQAIDYGIIDTIIEDRSAAPEVGGGKEPDSQ
jgi:ATP-dependent protease ClpP protease subunit